MSQQKSKFTIYLPEGMHYRLMLLAIEGLTSRLVNGLDQRRSRAYIEDR